MRASSLGASSRASRGLAFAAVLGAVMSVAGTASAQPEFPGAVRDALDMSCVPPCTICHVTNAGGSGTLKSLPNEGPGFGKHLYEDIVDANGDTILRLGNPGSIQPALVALEAAQSDVDLDGVTDVQELRAGTDPNVPGTDSLCGPEYGCARVEPKGRVDGVAGVAAIVAALGGVLLMRRGRR